MEVKSVQATGWTNPAITARFWAAMEEAERHQLAERLRQYREAANLSSEELAHRAGVSTKTISRLENAHGDEGPRRGTLEKIASALEIATDDLWPRLALTPDGASSDQLQTLENKLDHLTDLVAGLYEALERRPRRTRKTGHGEA